MRKRAAKTRRASRPIMVGRVRVWEPPVKAFKETSVGDSVTVAEAVAIAKVAVSM
jgi:ribosomal 50S subunit-recycling heat shock protein